MVVCKPVAVLRLVDGNPLIGKQFQRCPDRRARHVALAGQELLGQVRAGAERVVADKVENPARKIQVVLPRARC